MRHLYDSIVAQARHPHFYGALAVPDTVRGRFEVLGLHMYLILARLRDGTGGAANAEAETLAQKLVDCMFDDMDDVARELGISDMGVAPRIKKLARGFRSRLEAYEAALADGDATRLPLVVGEILFNNEEARAAGGEAIARYMRREQARLAGLTHAQIAAGEGLFGDPAMEEAQ